MTQKTTLLIALEALWWILTAVVAYAVLYPAHQAMLVWPFETWNIIFIAVLITFGRYIFLLQHTFLAKRQVLKAVLIVLLVPATFMLISGLNEFLSWIEDHTWDTLTGHLPLEPKRRIEAYLWNEMLFFAGGSIISAIVFAGRLLQSIWLTHNRGTV